MEFALFHFVLQTVSPSIVIDLFRWFFLDISYDQIELILKQREENAFVVTNGAFDTQYVIYMSIQSLTDELQLVKIDQIFQDGAFKYIAEGNSDAHSSVVEAVERFASSSEFNLVPAVHSHRQESMRSQASCDMDKPPAYTAAATYPSMVQSLPIVTTKVDTLRGEDGKINRYTNVCTLMRRPTLVYLLFISSHVCTFPFAYLIRGYLVLRY
jgi:hypothetical protein